MSQDTYLLGQLAVHYKLVAADRLAALMREEAKRDFRRSLGEAMVAEGLIQEQQLEKLLAVQKQLKEKAAAQAAAAKPAAEPAVPTGRSEGVADRLLGYAVERGASDLHVTTGERLLLRRNGELESVGEAVFDRSQLELVLADLLSAEQLDELRRRGQVDFATTLEGRARFRGNAYRFQDGLSAVLRVIPLEPPTLADLGLPSSLARLTAFHQGIVLLTGPAGSGKSSTLAALLRLVNEERRDHIVTIEDPIEFLHPPRRCSVNQRQVGRDTRSFARALKAALREDPDVIAIGELRDLETISLALTAAETGHLVLATLHTGSAIRTIDRVIGAFPPDQQPQIRAMFSESLRAVVSQRLLARADGAGRVAATEVLYGTRAVANLIRDRKTFQLRSILQTGAAQGMSLLDNSLAALVRAGTVAVEEARRHLEDPRALEAA